MSVETFTKSEFESALPVDKNTDEPLWQHAGVVSGEHVYHIDVAGTNKRIVIRSSVGANGLSAGTGKDSLRLWVEYRYRDKWRPLAKLDRWTTRVPGWQTRMTVKLRELWRLALADSRNHGNGGNEAVTNPVKANPRPKLDFGAPTTSPPPPQQTRTPNAEQVAAITSPVDGAIRVLAGPGSGKTVTVEERIAYLLDNGAEPDDILCVTFSKTMANEMLSRILQRNPDLADTAAERQICTIHALCYRLLREEGDTRNVAKEWQVKRALQELAEQTWPYVDERPGWKEVYLWVNTAKMRGLSAADDFRFFVDALDDYQGRSLHACRRGLDAKLNSSNLITFPDMLLDIELRLTRDRAFREKCQSRFKWVCCDEGQDVNGQAMRILSTLARPQNQFYIVGDTDQLLFRFAGATPEANLYDGFEERYGDDTVKLTINYRSTKVIIAACNRLIAHNYADAGGPYDEKYRKTLVAQPNAPEGDPITFEMYETVEAEAEALVESILLSLDHCEECSGTGQVREQATNDPGSLAWFPCDRCLGSGKGRQPGDFFVGARTRAQLGYLEGPLVRAKVPFINITGGSFWASKHVANVIAYVRLAHDTSNAAAFKRIFNVASNWFEHPWGKQKGEYCHHRYLGKAFMAACRDSYKNVWTAVNQRRSFGPGAEDLTSFVQELQAEMAWCPPNEAVSFVIEHCYRKHLAHEEGIITGDEAENGKLEDLRTVMDVASKFDTVDAFLAHVDEMVAAAEAARDKDWSNYAILSTIHRLKGLESPVVYGVGWCEGIDATSGQPRGLLPHTFSMVPPPQNGVLPTGGMGRIEDERCCGFVLASRAQEEVHLSGCTTYRKARMQPSRFIEEMGL